MKAKLKRSILLSLLACDGPMPEAALMAAAQMNVLPLKATDSDAAEALKDCSSEGFAQGVTDDFTHERSWTLTDRGIHQARKLRA